MRSLDQPMVEFLLADLGLQVKAPLRYFFHKWLFDVTYAKKKQLWASDVSEQELEMAKLVLKLRPNVLEIIGDGNNYAPIHIAVDQLSPPMVSLIGEADPTLKSIFSQDGKRAWEMVTEAMKHAEGGLNEVEKAQTLARLDLIQ